MAVSDDVAAHRWEGGVLQARSIPVVREARIRVHVNGAEWFSVLATPQDLDALAVGFLAGEGIIRRLADVRRVVVCPSQTCVEVWLTDGTVERPGRSTLTSGCGGGITFTDLSAERAPLTVDAHVTARDLGRLMHQLQERQRIRGIHTAALADADGLVLVTEDIGRHNTLDKLYGRCLQDAIATEGRILLATGRISAEMMSKAARMQTPIVVSRSSPTTLSIALATAWNMTLVGYVRRDSLNVYTGTSRVLVDAEEVGTNAQP